MASFNGEQQDNDQEIIRNLLFPLLIWFTHIIHKSISVFLFLP